MSNAVFPKLMRVQLEEKIERLHFGMTCSFLLHIVVLLIAIFV